MGFGALGQGDAKTAIVEALKVGYRSVCLCIGVPTELTLSITRQIDGAQMYENEDQCGAAIRESGIPRSEIFASK
jgi:hypothetical protein